MKTIKTLSAISLAISISLLAACGENTGSDTTTSTLSGSVFKGPVDDANISIMTVDGTTLATTRSTQGKFELPSINLPVDASVIFIATQGGQYKDEATGTDVYPDSYGLRTVFTSAELQRIMDEKTVIALTPETTIMANLVEQMMSDGQQATAALDDARQIIQSQLIDGTSPVPGISGDSLLFTGDLTAAIPASQSEALAKNRAISFSYEANELNLSPKQVFQLIEKRSIDLQDGTLDGLKDNTDRLSITDQSGNPRHLDELDQKTGYGRARARLLNNTIERLSQGNLNDNERNELGLLGFDMGAMDQIQHDNTAAQNNTKAHLTADNLPNFNYLPVLDDEDGDSTDNAATYTLTATPDVNVTINAPGESWVTPMWRYNGSELPPIIKARRDDNMTLNLINELPQETTIHWHGFEIPGAEDGGPDLPVATGSSKAYRFQLVQPASSLWFHPHPDMKTAEQVYKGLAGVFLLGDDISDQLEADNQLPSGQYDISMLIQDRRFLNKENGVRELAYKTSSMDNNGMLGNEILVNGAILPKLPVETRQYRFRLFSTANARTFDFALSDGKSFKVVATDGGLLNKPVDVDHIMLSAGERAEIIIDFSQYAAGDKVMLISKAFNAGMMQMSSMSAGNGNGMNNGNTGMGTGNGNGINGMGGTNGNNMANGPTAMTADGTRMDIMRFDITTEVTDTTQIYSQLPATAEISTRLREEDATRTRNFVMSMSMGGTDGGMSEMSFLINGKSFDMNRIDETIILDGEAKTEIWSIQNMSPMAHPFHAHAIQWQLLDRNGDPARGMDLGPKDTVLIQPGETVRIIGRFDPTVNSGKYMYHCHILEHEDAGMMGFFEVK